MVNDDKAIYCVQNNLPFVQLLWCSDSYHINVLRDCLKHNKLLRFMVEINGTGVPALSVFCNARTELDGPSDPRSSGSRRGMLSFSVILLFKFRYCLFILF